MLTNIRSGLISGPCNYSDWLGSDEKVLEEFPRNFAIIFSLRSLAQPSFITCVSRPRDSDDLMTRTLFYHQISPILDM